MVRFLLIHQWARLPEYIRQRHGKLWAVQTPQAFAAPLIRRAYAEVEKDKVEVTDDASAVERLGEPVKIYETNVPNLKITTVEDLQMAAAVVLKR